MALVLDQFRVTCYYSLRYRVTVGKVTDLRATQRVVQLEVIGQVKPSGENSLEILCQS